MCTEYTGKSTAAAPGRDLKVELHSVVFTDHTLTVPSDEALQKIKINNFL